jgi:hypothetical protein
MQGKPGESLSLSDRIGVVEEAYEFMLAYAAQGHPRGNEGEHIRDFLGKADEALHGLATTARDAVRAAGAIEASFSPFIDVLDSDVTKARAGIALALGQRAINSQIIDNLNASIHLRALLTDLFLIDEALASSTT